MKAEYINPFIASAIKVFETMISCRLTRGTPILKQGHQPNHEISGIIGLSGRAKGTVVLSVDREVAMKITETMLGERPPVINSDVADAIGEVTNMIAGHAKAHLERFAMSLSLPTVISGKGHCIEFPKEATPICIPFTCDWGPVDLEVALMEQIAPS